MINFNSLNYWNLWTVASSSVGAHFTKIRRPRTNVSFVPLLTPWFLTLILTILFALSNLTNFLLQYLKCRTYLIEPILFNYDQFMERIQLIFLQVNHFIECTVFRLLIIFFSNIWRRVINYLKVLSYFYLFNNTFHGIFPHYKFITYSTW